VCGQKGDDFHRSIFHLVTEAFEGLTHFDGRFWRTLPRLLLRPGALTRDYLDGHRAAQIPPFRLFLVVLLLVFFAGSMNFKANDVHLRLKPDAGLNAESAEAIQDAQELRQAAQGSPAGQWLAERVEHAVKDPAAFLTAMEHWSHRFAILMLPIAALLLSLIFALRRGIYVFDHLIFSMHSLSFQGLLLTWVFLLGTVASWSGWLLVIAPVHLFVHMRGAYQTSVVGTLVRMAVLFQGSAFAFGALMAGLVLVGLATAH
jgi:hypothetical protein